MKVNELFIYNETYPLPPDQYPTFKKRVDNCTKNPMCLSKVKYDVETFISGYGRKNGSKLENGDESGFLITPPGLSSPGVSDLPPSEQGGIASNDKNLMISGFIIGLFIASVWIAYKKRSIIFGIVAIIIAAIGWPVVSKTKVNLSLGN